MASKKTHRNRIKTVSKTAISKPGPRRRKLSKTQKKEHLKSKIGYKTLPAAWTILKNSLKHLYKYKKLFLGILIIYGLLDLLLVRGLSANFQLNNLRQALSDNAQDSPRTIGTGFALFGLLLGSSATTDSDAGGAYQSILIVITSLALIWALRHTYAETGKIRLRDAFYKSTQPLTQFVLVALVVIVHLLPLLITSSLYTSVQSGGLAATGIEQLIWAIVLVAGFGLTAYLLSSSIIALYIVTLPNTGPRAALKAARNLVRYRRVTIIRKIIFLPVFLLLLSGVIMVPLIMLFAPAAEAVFLIFSIILIGVVHSYFYSLYRSLL